MSKKDPRRRELLRALVERQREGLLAAIPLPHADLLALFDFLDKGAAEDCDHSLRMTEGFLRRRGLPTEQIVPWLRSHGGYCDCEVLLNVEETFGELLSKLAVRQTPTSTVATSDNSTSPHTDPNQKTFDF